MPVRCQACGRIFKAKTAHNCMGGHWTDDKGWEETPKDAPVAVSCESCKHIRARTPKDVKVEGGHDLDHHWCSVNDMPTTPPALRCGGDDYEPKNL